MKLQISKFRYFTKLRSVRRNSMYRLLFIAIIVSSVFNAHSQKQSLTAKLTKADSVFLISHKSIPGSSIVAVDSLGKQLVFPLFVDGRLNDNSVQEKVLLDAIEIKRVGKMLSYRKDNMIEQGGCFAPHHAIVIINKGKLSYIDLCFGCISFSTSDDIRLTDIEQKTWKELYAFFKSKGITYEMH